MHLTFDLQDHALDLDEEPDLRPTLKAYRDQFSANEDFIFKHNHLTVTLDVS